MMFSYSRFLLFLQNCWEEAAGSRLHGIGVGLGSPRGVWVVGQRHPGSVISLLMWLKQSYKPNEDILDIFSLQIQGLLSDPPTAA